MTSYPLTSLITLLVCLLMLATGIHVGRARGRYGVKAPAVSGHELFERAYRIQMNTLETAVMVLPALWINAGFISDRGAAALGLVWLLSRVWYAMAYSADPAKRGSPFVVSMVSFSLLWCAALFGIMRVLIR